MLIPAAEVAPPGALVNLTIAALLVAACTALHAAGLLGVNAWLRGRLSVGVSGYWVGTWLLVRLAWAIVVLHLLEILFWAVAFVALGCMPDMNTAFYFSSITYTTVGYGDVVLPDGWHNFSSAEALTGILMAGLSTGFFFNYIGRALKVSGPTN
jgi:ABC-type multidrug transport system permease subunit